MPFYVFISSYLSSLEKLLFRFFLSIFKLVCLLINTRVLKKFLLCQVFIAVHGLCLTMASRGYLLVAVCGLLVAVASRWRAQAQLFQGIGVPLAQQLNPQPLHWQADS